MMGDDLDELAAHLRDSGDAPLMSMTEALALAQEIEGDPHWDVYMVAMGMMMRQDFDSAPRVMCWSVPMDKPFYIQNRQHWERVRPSVERARREWASHFLGEPQP